MSSKPFQNEEVQQLTEYHPGYKYVVEVQANTSAPYGDKFNIFFRCGPGAARCMDVNGGCMRCMLLRLWHAATREVLLKPGFLRCMVCWIRRLEQAHCAPLRVLFLLPTAALHMHHPRSAGLSSYLRASGSLYLACI